MTDDERAHLEMFDDNTYGMSIPRELAKAMEAKGWVSWVPPKFGTTLWNITDAGRAALAARRPR